MTVREKINAALIKFYTKLNKKILNSMEEIEANTDESNLAGAMAVSELYNNLTASLQNINIGSWTKLTSVVGTTPIDLTAISFNELHVKISSGTSCYVIQIIKEDLSDTVQYFYTGYYVNATGYGRGVVTVTKSEIKLYHAMFDTSEKTSSATVEVYYR